MLNSWKFLIVVAFSGLIPISASAACIPVGSGTVFHCKNVSIDRLYTKSSGDVQVRGVGDGFDGLTCALSTGGEVTLRGNSAGFDAVFSVLMGMHFYNGEAWFSINDGAADCPINWIIQEAGQVYE